MATDKKTGWAFVGALLAAILASSCCLLPLIFVFLGVGGVWLAQIQALEPYRPLFAVIALGILGWAIYREVLFARRQTECACEVTLKDKVRRVLIGGAVVLTLGALAFPYLLPTPTSAEGSSSAMMVQQEEEVSPRWVEVTLAIEGMTCGGCVVTVERALGEVEGVKDVAVSLEPPQAVVLVNARQIKSLESLAEVVTRAGYPAHVKSKKELS